MMVSRGDVARTSWLSASWPRSGCGGEGDGDGAKCGVEGRMYKMIHDSIFSQSCRRSCFLLSSRGHRLDLNVFKHFLQHLIPFILENPNMQYYIREAFI